MSPLEVTAAVGTVAGAVTGLVAAGGALLRVERRGRQLVNGLLGDEHHPGIVARVDQLSGDLAGIKAELCPNHGSSLRDAVDRIEVGLASHAAASWNEVHR